MLVPEKTGCFVFLFDGIEDGPCFADHWLNSLETAKEFCHKTFGVPIEGWSKIADSGHTRTARPPLGKLWSPIANRLRRLDSRITSSSSPSIDSTYLRYDHLIRLQCMIKLLKETPVIRRLQKHRRSPVPPAHHMILRARVSNPPWPWHAPHTSPKPGLSQSFNLYY